MSDSCGSKLEAYFFPDTPVSKEARSRQHLTPANRVSQSTLLVTRVLFCIVMVVIWIQKQVQSIQSPTDTLLSQFHYFTRWGLWLTCIYFVLIVVSHFKASPQTASTGWFVMWKWCVVLHQATWMWETVITIIYWGMLNDNTQEGFTGWWDDLSIHALPLLFIMIDWAMCGWLYEFRTVWLDVGSILVYGAVNFAATKTRGKPVYPEVISWENWWSLAIVVALTAFNTCIFIVEYFLTKWKINAMGFYGLKTVASTENTLTLAERN